MILIYIYVFNINQIKSMNIKTQNTDYIRESINCLREHALVKSVDYNITLETLSDEFLAYARPFSLDFDRESIIFAVQSYDIDPLKIELIMSFPVYYENY